VVLEFFVDCVQIDRFQKREYTLRARCLVVKNVFGFLITLWILGGGQIGSTAWRKIALRAISMQFTLVR
jgi:hypothetical protein